MASSMAINWTAQRANFYWLLDAAFLNWLHWPADTGVVANALPLPDRSGCGASRMNLLAWVHRRAKRAAAGPALGGGWRGAGTRRALRRLREAVGWRLAQGHRLASPSRGPNGKHVADRPRFGAGDGVHARATTAGAAVTGVTRRRAGVGHRAVVIAAALSGERSGGELAAVVSAGRGAGRWGCHAVLRSAADHRAQGLRALTAQRLELGRRNGPGLRRAAALAAAEARDEALGVIGTE